MILHAFGGTPVESLGGQVDVTFDSVTPTTIVAGQLASFRYLVVSRANQPAQFTIAPTVTVTSNQSQWNTALEVRDDNNQVLPQGRIMLAPNVERFVRVVLTSVPAAPANAQFTLTVTANAPGVTPRPDSRSFTVGQATAPEDTSITIEVINSVPPAALSGNTVKLAEGAAARINCRATYTVAGTYDVGIGLISGSAWDAQRNTSSTAPTTTITQQDLNNPEGKAIRSPEYIIRALTGATAAGEVEIRIQRQGQTTRRTRRLTLERLS